MAIAYLLAGGNLDNTIEKFNRLSDILQKQVGNIIGISKLYQSAPWGFESLHPFINQAIAIQTTLSPEKLLDEIQHIEKSFGRTKNNTKQYQDRSMDIDIIFYDDVIIQSERLTVPHPFMHLRRFVLTPLSEIAPQIIHPVLQKNITELSIACEDKNEVQEIIVVSG